MTLSQIFVYNRPWHTMQTEEALKMNDLASNSKLLIFSLSLNHQMKVW